MGSAERLIGQLATSSDPTVAYRARTLLLDEPEADPAIVALRSSIASSPRAVALLSGREPDGTMPGGPYRKWQGPHWTLVGLALIAYPPGDPSLLPMRDQVLQWLSAKRHFLPPSTRTLPGQEDRVRRCASQEGNAIWSSLVLGIDDERTGALVDRLIGWQWPDGGWNCDVRPEARTSSVVETAIPTRALWMYGTLRGRPDAIEAAARAAEFLLRRRLLWRERDGRPIRPEWGGDPMEIHFPIQFYDVLFALEVMADIGMIGDPRCDDALAVLASKQLADGGFPIELRNATTSSEVRSRGTRADWGPGGKRTGNPLVTVAALGVLRRAAAARGVRWPGP